MAEMTMEQKLYQSLSLCRRAGALVMGFDAVCEAVLQGKVGLVLCAGDIGANTEKRVRQRLEDMADIYKLPLTQEQLEPVSRRAVAVYGVQDENLANLVRSKLAECGTAAE